MFTPPIIECLQCLQICQLPYAEMCNNCLASAITISSELSCLKCGQIYERRKDEYLCIDCKTLETSVELCEQLLLPTDYDVAKYAPPFLPRQDLLRFLFENAPWHVKEQVQLLEGLDVFKSRDVSYCDDIAAYSNAIGNRRELLLNRSTLCATPKKTENALHESLVHRRPRGRPRTRPYISPPERCLEIDENVVKRGKTSPVKIPCNCSSTDNDLSEPAKLEEQTLVKRQRGRPRTRPQPHILMNTGNSQGDVVKRGRGRPRKYNLSKGNENCSLYS